jgi:superfamily II DNA or RNA helicase
MELRDYQNKTIEYILNYFDNKNNTRLCVGSPTGSGKTVIFSQLVKELIQKNQKILIAVHQVELLKQTAKQLNKIDIYPNIISAENKNIQSNNIYLCMIETLKRRENKLKHLFTSINYFIVDECHRSNFFKLLDHFKKVIGFTATPQYEVIKEKCLKDYYHNLYEASNINNLIDRGYLMPSKAFVPQTLYNQTKGFKIKSNMGEYSESDMFNKFTEKKVFASVLESIKKFKKGRTLVFNSGVKHSQLLNSELKKLGYHSFHLDGNTPQVEREKILKELEINPETIICNCNVLTTGFDSPFLETIILNRLTKSENLFIQMVGRGSRPCPAINKTEFVLLDLFGNSLKLNKWEAERNWQAKFEDIAVKEKMEAPVKLCPNCEAVNYAWAQVCKHCGHKFETNKKNIEIDNVLVLLEESITSIINDTFERGYKPYSALFKIVDFVFRNKKKKDFSIIENELMIGLEAWIKVYNQKFEKKKNFDKWHKNFMIEIYMKKEEEIK